MALPERKSSNELQYSCRVQGAKLLSSGRDDELSDELSGLREDVEGYFMTPRLFSRMEKRGGVIIFTDDDEEFTLKATSLRRPESGVAATLIYPESYGKLNDSPRLNKYGFNRSI